jgi:hypothetical protein
MHAGITSELIIRAETATEFVEFLNNTVCIISGNQKGKARPPRSPLYIIARNRRANGFDSVHPRSYQETSTTDVLEPHRMTFDLSSITV